MMPNGRLAREKCERDGMENHDLDVMVGACYQRSNLDPRAVLATYNGCDDIVN